MKKKNNGGLSKLVDLFIEKKEEPAAVVEHLSDDEMLEKLKTDPNAIYSLSVDQMCRESFLLKAIKIRPELINVVIEEQSVDFSFVYKAIESKFEILDVIDQKYFSDINFIARVAQIEPRIIECADEKIVSQKDKERVFNFCEGNVSFKQTVKEANMLNIAVSSAVLKEAENKVKAQFDEICREKGIKYKDTIPCEVEDALKARLEEVWRDVRAAKKDQLDKTIKNIKEINI